MKKNWIKGFGFLLIVAVLLLHAIVAVNSFKSCTSQNQNIPNSFSKKVELIYKN